MAIATSKSMRHGKKSRSGEVSSADLKRAVASVGVGGGEAFKVTEKLSDTGLERDDSNAAQLHHRKLSFPADRQSAASAQQSPPKGKKNFFEGFRNPLRPKSKAESSGNGLAGTVVSVTTGALCSSHSLDSTAPEPQRPPVELASVTDNSRRFSETGSPRALRPSSVSEMPDSSN